MARKLRLSRITFILYVFSYFEVCYVKIRILYNRAEIRIMFNFWIFDVILPISTILVAIF